MLGTYELNWIDSWCLTYFSCTSLQLQLACVAGPTLAIIILKHNLWLSVLCAMCSVVLIFHSCTGYSTTGSQVTSSYFIQRALATNDLRVGQSRHILEICGLWKVNWDPRKTGFTNFTQIFRGSSASVIPSAGTIPYTQELCDKDLDITQTQHTGAYNKPKESWMEEFWYLLDLTADPVLFSFLSAAINAAIVLSDTWSFWSTVFTFSFTTEIPTVSFSVSPTLLSREMTLADALALNWCFSSNALALFTASCLIAEPFASILETTSWALVTYTLPFLGGLDFSCTDRWQTHSKVIRFQWRVRKLFPGY